MNYFDASTWIGQWPFAFYDAHTPKSLQAHLRRHGIRRALVSSLGAVFAPEPGPANAALLKDTLGVQGLEPVPVINPSLGNWAEQVALADADPRVRAVRVLPNYHNFALGARCMTALVAELRERGLHLIVQMQLIDSRHEYHAMTIKPVPAADLEALLVREPKLSVLASGLQRPDLMRLAKKHARLLADLSFAEWYDTMEHLREQVPAKQLLFSSHTPLLITAAATAKLEASTLSRTQKAAVAGGNLERWLAR